MAQELDPALAGDFSGSFVGITPQGWLREWDADGQVRTSAAAWTYAEEALAQANAVVTSVDDINGDWAVAEQWARWARVLVVTRGPDGCTVYVKGQAAREFPAPPVTEVEPTGAGEIFAADYFVNFYETGDPWVSARFANQVAALSVTRPGLEGVPSRDEAGYCRTRAVSG
jgi:sugar/nucleoside kinase (ribokinase family)